MAKAVRFPTEAPRSRSQLRATLAGAGLLMLVLAVQPAQAQGLKLGADAGDDLRWQARVQLSSLDKTSGSRLVGANVLGDYYLTGSWLGTKTRGGLRATGGLMFGAPSLLQSSGALALGSSSLARQQVFSVGQRQLSLASPMQEHESNLSAPYIGIGYTGQSLRGGWGFSADLGVMRLGRSGGAQPSLEETLMDLRLRPVLHFGLSYNY